MQPINWCNLCQSKPATGVLTGYFQGVEDEQMELLTCGDCARESFNNA